MVRDYFTKIMGRKASHGICMGSVCGRTGCFSRPGAYRRCGICPCSFLKGRLRDIFLFICVPWTSRAGASGAGAERSGTAFRIWGADCTRIGASSSPGQDRGFHLGFFRAPYLFSGCYSGFLCGPYVGSGWNPHAIVGHIRVPFRAFICPTGAILGSGMGVEMARSGILGLIWVRMKPQSWPVGHIRVLFAPRFM